MGRPKKTVADKVATMLEKSLPEGFTYANKYQQQGSRLLFGYLCPAGHTFYSSYGRLITSNRCTVCVPDARVRSVKFAAHNKKLFTGLLENNPGYEFNINSWPPEGPVEITCDQGHTFTRKSLRPAESVSCHTCGTLESQKGRLADEVKDFATVLRFASLTDCDFLCKHCGAKYSHGDFGGSHQRRCPKCYTPSSKLTLRDWQARFDKAQLGITILEQSDEGYLIRCSNMHEYNVKYLGNYSPCSRCSATDRKYSKPHKKLVDWLGRRRLEVEVNVRGLVSNHVELDILIRNKKLVIEVDGIYWHNERRGEDANRRLHRRKLVEDSGHRLMRFWDTELTNPKPVLSFLLSTLGLSKHRVGARECSLELVSPEEAKTFLEEWHIQGSCGSTHRYGLKHSGNLLAVMTFGKPRLNKNFEWELLRFCVRGNYNVPGAASKLLTAFRRDVQPTNVLSYADRRYSTGGVYEALGFTLQRVTPPGYFYFGPKGIVSRYSAQKHKLSRLLDKFDPSKSETYNMNQAGYTKVFDCGQLVYVLGAQQIPAKVKHPKVQEVTYGKRQPLLDIKKHQALLKSVGLSATTPEGTYATEFLEYTCSCGHKFIRRANFLEKVYAKSGNKGCAKCANRLPKQQFLSKLPEGVLYHSGYAGVTSRVLVTYKPTGVKALVRASSLIDGRIPYVLRKSKC